MTISIEKVKGKTARRTRTLYRASFQEWERIPFWSLRLRSMGKDMDLLAFCDGEEYCGFACLTLGGQAAYVHYLAVEKGKRGQGLGGKMLDCLAEHYAPLSIALDIEAVRPGTDGAKLRSRHKKFYLRNGFTESGYCYKDGGVVYEILVRGSKPDETAYGKLINKLAFGLTKIAPSKMKK